MFRQLPVMRGEDSILAHPDPFGHLADPRGIAILRA